MNYKFLTDRETGSNDTTAIQRINDNGTQSTIPFDPDNRDYQAYLAWVAEGNTAEAAD